MKPTPTLLTLLLCLTHPASAPPTLAAAESKPVPISMTVDPAHVPTPALRYALFYDPLDQIPGNAAVAYSRAIRLIIQNDRWKEHADQIQKYLGQPLGDLPTAEVVALLNQHATALAELLKATRYERCDWEVPIRTEGASVLLPHLAELRSASRLLTLDLRRCLLQGRFDDAVARLRAGLTMARHTHSGALLIEGLVGIAIAQQMLATVEDFIQQPHAPNLYWALTDLPPAFMTFWNSTVWERSFVYIHLPMLREIGQRPITTEDLRRAVTTLHQLGGPAIASNPTADAATTLGLAGLGWAVYPRARAALARQGMTDAQLDPLPAPDVIARYVGGAYVRQRDNFFRWAALPYPQARLGLAATEADLPQAYARDPIENVIPRMVLPALARAADRFAELDRLFATLRCLEALRNHAARHQRQWPSSLDAIQETPIPHDPMTGLPFLYRVEGPKAILEAPPLPSGTARKPKRYELTLRP